MTREELVGLILATAETFNQDLEYKIDVARKENAALFGEDGVLDSLNLVAFVVAVEQGIADRFGADIALADEKAMSQHRTPFRTVGSLADYVAARMAEAAR